MTSINRFILHIGYGKTGTTSLQRFLAHNRQALIEQGVLYPDVTVNGACLGTPDHNMVGRALAGRKGWFGLSAEEYFSQFKEQSKHSNTVLLSAETFLGGVQPWEFTESDSYYQKAQEVVEQLGKLTAGAEVLVIVYLRRQDQWMESVVNQTIKFAGLMPDSIRSCSTDQLLGIYEPRLDYAKVLEPWARVYGDSSISVGVYEKSQLYGNEIITDFIQRAGLSGEGLEHPDWSAGSRNNRLNRDVLEFKRILNRISRPKYLERVIAEGLREISSEMDHSDDVDYPILGSRQRRNILDSCNSSNTETARRYLKREFLFNENLPELDEKIHDYPGLSVEQAIELKIRLSRYQRSARGRKRLLKHWLAEIMRKKIPWLHAPLRVVYRKLGRFI